MRCCKHQTQSMARPLRIEFPGAVYHVTARGDRREPIYMDDEDRSLHLGLIGKALMRFDARALAYCLMGNHVHLVLQTQQPNLSRIMRHINGVYTQAYNRRHGVVGHLFQGRYHAILVDSDAYLLALCRYVERNPVAAGLVAEVGQWPWSSHLAHASQVAAPMWLDSDTVYAQLLGRIPASRADRTRAAGLYSRGNAGAAASMSVEEVPASGLWAQALRQQIFLGDESFVARVQQHLEPAQRTSKEVPAVQRRLPTRDTAPLSLEALIASGADRNSAVLQAYRAQGMTMTAIGQALGLSVSRVSRLIASLEAKGKT